MSRRDEESREAELRLAESRREAEARLAQVRTAIETEIGFAPRKRFLWLLLVAGAGGLALALRGRQRGRQRGRKPGRRKLKQQERSGDA